MKEVVRVLHIFSGFGGGVSSLIRNLIENKTDDVIFDTMAFSYKNGDAFVELINRKGGKVYTMPRLKQEGFLSIISFVKCVLNENKYDVVHCHLSSFTALPFLALCRYGGIKKIIIHAHSTVQDSWWDRLPIFYSIGQWINYHYADVFFTCSDLAAEYVFGKKYLLKKEPILIPNGINEELFEQEITLQQQDEYCKEFGITSEDKVLLHMGRFNRQKNHEFLLRVIKMLKDSNQRVVLLLAGEGELQDDIKLKSKELRICDNVRFLNRRNDVSLLMQFADVVLLPSLNEGLPTVAIECQAAGTPMLLSDKITRQCDMGIGLVEFMSIGNEKQWVNRIIDTKGRKSVDICLDAIRKKGFTAKETGTKYCHFLVELVSQ